MFTLGRRTTALVALALVATIAPVSPTVGNVEAAGGPPRCAYKDVVTPARAYSQFSYTLVDTTYRVPSGYVPKGLRATGVAGGGRIRSVAIKDLRAMFAAAKRAGAPLRIKSSYRSYATQVSTFRYWVRITGYKRALLASARPGHSEHQLGTAIDVTGSSGIAPWLYADWGTTKAGAWMRKNSWKYGFVMSYPKGKSPSITCYKYEPWHFRFVGRATAKAMHDSGLAPRAWLWSHKQGLDD